MVSFLKTMESYSMQPHRGTHLSSSKWCRVWFHCVKWSRQEGNKSYRAPAQQRDRQKIELCFLLVCITTTYNGVLHISLLKVFSESAFLFWYIYMYVHFLFEVKATYGLHFCMHFFTFNFDTFSIFQNKGGSQCSMQKSIQRIPKWKSIPHAMKDVYPMEPKQKVFPQLENISPMKDVPQWKVFPKWKMFPWPSGRWKIIPLMQKIFPNRKVFPNGRCFPNGNVFPSGSCFLHIPKRISISEWTMSRFRRPPCCIWSNVKSA